VSTNDYSTNRKFRVGFSLFEDRASVVESVQNVGVVRPLAEMAGGPSARR
jgi:hypothetical protein